MTLAEAYRLARQRLAYHGYASPYGLTWSHLAKRPRKHASDRITYQDLAHARDEAAEFERPELAQAAKTIARHHIALARANSREPEFITMARFAAALEDSRYSEASRQTSDKPTEYHAHDEPMLNHLSRVVLTRSDLSDTASLTAKLRQL